jgi:two-component system LytT family response regulator
MIQEKLTAIIVDDEEKARNMLQLLVDEHCPKIKVLAHCKNVPEAVAAINEHKPQIIFLDVDMPGYSGFQLLDFFQEVNFEIIFTTAFSEYALQAFRVSAIDFLLKPIDIDQLIDAVEKVKKKTQPDVYNKQLNLIRSSNSKKPLETIAISTSGSIEFVQVDDIIVLQADRAYTKIILTNEQEIIASKNIKEFEETLAASLQFFRAHRSCIINLKQVLRYNKTEGGNIEMKNGNQVPLSKDAKDEFIKKMTN